MIQPKKGHKALRLGRSSEPGFRYFITICGKDKGSLLTNETFASAIQISFQKAENDKVFEITSYTIMPDHIHLVFRLGSKLSLGKAISRIKSEVSRNLETNSSLWQKGFYDHKLRNDGELYPILHYIFMNPH